MSRKKMRSKADEFEMDEAGYDEEYGDAPAEQHIYDNASGAEPEHRAPKAKKKKRKNKSPAFKNKIQKSKDDISLLFYLL